MRQANFVKVQNFDKVYREITMCFDVSETPLCVS